MTDIVRVGVGVFVIRDGKFLILQRKGSHGSGTWSLPGGHLEYGESFENASRREVLEETGCSIKNLRFGAVTNDIFETDKKHYITIWMVSDWDGGEPKIMEPEKCVSQRWANFDNLPEPLFLSWVQLKTSIFYEDLRKQLMTPKGEELI